MRHDDPASEVYRTMAPLLDERQRRLFAAALSQALGYGGIAHVSEGTDVARTTIGRGLRELKQGTEQLASQRRVRRPGGGRKRLVDQDPVLLGALEALVEPLTRGDPDSPLRWTCKSTRQLAAELQRQGYRISHETVAQLLHHLGYSLQGNKKTKEGTSHPDRNGQFEEINRRAALFIESSQPVVSVDAKKKELVGEFRNGGREWQPKGQPVPVNTHDFIDPQKGRATPYGVYDVANNEAWVSVGTDHDTAEFAAETICRWWKNMGSETHPSASDLMITADSGGSNSYRSRLWKLSLQRVANETGLRLWVCHLPPGTSKWNKIEHRLFSYISQNWRGRPLVSHETILNLIAGTTTRNGLRVKAQLDANAYPLGKKVSDSDLDAVLLREFPFHPEWNYIIVPECQHQVAALVS
jgi:transposase